MQSSQVPEKRAFWLRLSPRNGTAAQNEWCSVLLVFAVLGRCSHLATHFGKGGGCMVASENHSTRRSVGVLVLRDCSGRHLGPRSGYGTNMARSINMTPNKESSCLTTSNSESATMQRAKRSSSRHSNRSA